MSDMSNWNETANNKKSKNNEEQLKQLFQKAFNQFTSGCGRLLCENNYCASNPKFGLLSQSDAIKMALIQIRNRSSDFYICDIIESIKAQEISQNAKFGDFSQFVERSFSSVEILEISFLTDNGANCKEILSNKKSAIDYKGLEIAYEIILKNVFILNLV
ncbi:hypothetical protein MHBO_003225 [Bonamia ostreae]|uniref:Ubiquitin-protein ligase E3A N-terminal zinc-binding domain-containing protein n=1 Tax=Bonamia ostreae TaxID=126728 RepID=A0ABV2APW0_9EUKA